MKSELSNKAMVKIIVCLSLLAVGTFGFLSVKAKFFGKFQLNKQSGNIAAESDIVKSTAYISCYAVIVCVYSGASVTNNCY